MNKLWLGIGILCFLVPVFLQIIDKKEQSSIIDTYQKEIEMCQENELEKCLKEAQVYNATLFALKKSALGEEKTLDYMSQLNVTSTGMMGHLQIPKIDLNLPIYHGTSDEVLTVGIGHLEGTSLPVGGLNTRAVLTGHCGLPSAELFTRLDEMEVGDPFFLSVCNQMLKYEIVDVQVVEPNQVQVIEIEEEKDLVSLITCTPFGINTHRLVVTGERMEMAEENAEMEMNDDKGGVDGKIYCLVAVCVVPFLWFGCRSLRRKHKHCDK